MVDAQDRGDVDAIAEAGKKLEVAMRVSAKTFAKTIAEKYVHPPHSTDFAIMFVPTESLYAEVARRPGLIDSLQREHRVRLAGPTNHCVLLNSRQIGFRSLAGQERSTEVWKPLGAVRAEFHKFGDVLDKVHKKLGQASNTIKGASSKSRAIERKLRAVEELLAGEARAVLLGPAAGDERASASSDDPVLG